MSKKGPSIPRQLLAKPGMQVVLFIITIVYVISPVDIIPDVMPVIGWLDDLAVLLAQIAAFVIYLQEKRQQYVKTQDKGNESI